MRIEKILELVKSKAKDKSNIQIFFTECCNLGKEKIDFYDKDLTIYYHPVYDYFEVLGLSTSAQRRLDAMLDRMNNLKN